jgi:hypothetical protein
MLMKKIFLSLCFLIAFINGKAQNLSNRKKDSLPISA